MMKKVPSHREEAGIVKILENPSKANKHGAGQRRPWLGQRLREGHKKRGTARKYEAKAGRKKLQTLGRRKKGPGPAPKGWLADGRPRGSSSNRRSFGDDGGALPWSQAKMREG